MLAKPFHSVPGIVAFLVLVAATLARAAEPKELESGERPKGTIAFASVGPRHWDLYLRDKDGSELPLTDDSALDYNAAFSPDGKKIAFVSSGDGNMELYVMGIDRSDIQRLTDNFALDDHPTWSPDGEQIAFTSTREPAPAGRAWNSIYVMNADGSAVRRLSGDDAADYSPAWSPRGDLIAFASGSGKSGESDVYVMNPDGTGRRLVVENGGWPTFIEDGAAIAFHSRREKNRWDVWRVGLDGSGLNRLVENASMPRATPDGRKLAVVVQGKANKQIAVLDVASGSLEEVTSDATDHWNPTITPDGRSIVYHKQTPGKTTPNVELWGAPSATRLNMLRLAGAFPAFSPDRKRLALTGGSFARIDVMNLDGSKRKTIFEGKRRSLFGTSWSHEPEQIAFSYGEVFAKPGAGVNIMAASPDEKKIEPLTADAGNNGFLSYSPDGKQIVFRSGRDGDKNLYIMDRDGKNVRRLTKGKWTDTMCDWSPLGDWITFASDRGDDFEVWLIRPDGSGLHKLIGGGGRHNHPHFSPDAKWIVFTSQRAGYSAEEVSLPSQPQPYGDLFVIRTDGSRLTRLTHNGFEEGTPAWSPVREITPSDEGDKGEADY
jgi:Tol biopolymer transport system component